MEQEAGQDPENDRPADPQPPAGPSHPARAPPGPAASSPGSPSGDDAHAEADADRWRVRGESVFGPWDALEGTLGAAREREELLAGFAAGGVWDKYPPGPELAAALARAAGRDWRCAGRPARRRSACCGRWRRPVVVGGGAAGDDPGADPRRRPGLPGPVPHGDLPDGWDDSLLHEISLALAVSPPSADKQRPGRRGSWAPACPGLNPPPEARYLDLTRAPAGDYRGVRGAVG